MAEGSSFGGTTIPYWIAPPVLNVLLPASLASIGPDPDTCIADAIAAMNAVNAATTDPYLKLIVHDFKLPFDGVDFRGLPECYFYGQACQPGALITSPPIFIEPSNLMANPNTLTSVIAVNPKHLAVISARNSDVNTAYNDMLTGLYAIQATNPGLVVRWTFVVYDGSRFYAIAVYALSMELLTEPML